MKNTYVMSYFPLLSIMLFCLSFSVRIELTLIDFLKKTGIYQGMREFLSNSEIKLTLFVVLYVILFMVFAALKLVANTINELSLLFFSKDTEGESLKSIRAGSLIYLVGGTLSVVSIYSYIGIIAIFTLSTIVYFIYFVYKISGNLTMSGTIGVVFFQVIVWSTILLSLIFSG